MPHEIIPAILESSFEKIGEKALRALEVASWVQIDICDGIFVPTYSWPFENHAAEHDDGSSAGDIDDLAQLPSSLSLELHLMTVNPEELIHEWLARPEVKRILVHPESTLQLERTLSVVRENGREAGVSLLLSTPIDALHSVMHLVDRVQLMGIETIGRQGEPLAEDAVIKVRQLREMYPDVTISVDGGVTLENAPLLLDAGADALVVGSALFRTDDLEKTYNSFARLTRGDN